MLPVIVVTSDASTHKPGERSSGENALSVEAKTGLFAATRNVITSEFALPERLDAPMVTLWSPTAVLLPVILPFASIDNPLGNPEEVNAVGPYKALTVPATGAAVSA